MGNLSLFLADEDATVAAGGALADAAVPGLVIYLEGDLGMGKTTFSRGFVQGMGHVGAVKSPTYTLVEPYDLDGRLVYHFDLYRLGDPEELEFIGIRDYIGTSAICLVEWPERGAGVLPGADIAVSLSREDHGRRLEYAAGTGPGRAVLASLA